MIHRLKRVARLSEDAIRRTLRLHSSQKTLEQDAARFWSRPITSENSLWWHARDSGIFAENGGWDAMGQRHLALYRDFQRLRGQDERCARAVDWGCGGGANTLPLLDVAQTVYGVDVSDGALAEAARQCAGAGEGRFVPVHIDVPTPEMALDVILPGVDLFVSFYVFEVIPGAEYGRRILRVARDLLRPGGAAIIQVKYATQDWRTHARRWGYTRGAANMTTYFVDEFWALADACGLTPRYVVLVPKPREVPDERYAYFMLEKM